MAMLEGNWKERTTLLLGGNAVEQLAHSRVMIAGVGGVGAYAAEMICRAGGRTYNYCRCRLRCTLKHKPSAARHALYGGAQKG